jgi:DNA-binding winged helix-turn-helix (wHTH) protein
MVGSVVAYRFGPFLLRNNESLWVGDTLLPLSPLQLRLLCLLCRHPQQVLERETIIEAVWGHSEVSDVSLARAIHGLRNRLVVGGKPSELIRNIYGRGYILTQPVSVVDDSLPFPRPVEAALAG